MITFNDNGGPAIDSEHTNYIAEHAMKYLPKVGETCEIKHKDWFSWKMVKVAAVTNQHLIVLEFCDYSKEEHYLLEYLELRPIKSQKELAVDAMNECVSPWVSSFEDIYDAIEAGKIPGVVLEKKRRKIKITFDKICSSDEIDINVRYLISVDGKIVVNDSIEGSISAPYSKTYDVEDFDVCGSICVDLLCVGLLSDNNSLSYKAEWVD